MVALVQSASGTAGESASVSSGALASSPTAGNLLIATISYGAEGGSADPSAVKLSTGGSFTKLGSIFTANWCYCAIYYRTVVSGDGTSATVTWGSTKKGSGIFLDEFSSASGFGATSPTARTGTSSAPTWASISPASTSIMIGGMGAGKNRTFTAPTGYTSADHTGLATHLGARVHKSSPAASEAPTASLSASTRWATVFAEILDAGSAGFQVDPSFLDSGVTHAPTVSLSQTASPSFLSSGATYAPAVGLSKTASPSFLDSGVTHAPSAALSQTASPSFLDTGTVHAPAVGLDQTASPTLLASGSAPAPVVGLGRSASVSYLADGTSPAPNVGLGQVGSPSYLSASSTPPPAVGLDVQASPSFLSSGSTPAPSATLASGGFTASPSFLAPPTFEPIQPLGVGTLIRKMCVAFISFVDRQVVSGNWNVSVVAFDASGVSNVRFRVGGIEANVTAMSTNTETGLHEYWTAIDTTQLADGLQDYEIEVTPVSGHSGWQRGKVWVNNSSSLYSGSVWVDPVGGSDTNTGTEASPFLTLKKARDTLAGADGGQGGGTIYCKAGTLPMIGATAYPAWHETETWTTVTRDPAATIDQVVLADGTNPQDGDGFRFSHMKFSGVTIQGTLDNRNPSAGSGFHSALWCDSCVIEGKHRADSGRTIQEGAAWDLGCYFTDCETRKLVDAYVPSNNSKILLVRGGSVHQYGSDAFKNFSGLAADVSIYDQPDVTGIQNVVIASGGSGYAVNDTVRLAAAGATVTETLTVSSVTGGAVTGLTITDGGEWPTGSEPTGVAEATTNISSAGTGLTLNMSGGTAWYSFHQDLYQTSATTHRAIIYNCRAVSCFNQGIFLSDNPFGNIAIVGNLIESTATTGMSMSISNDATHVYFEGNTLMGRPLTMGAAAGPYTFTDVHLINNLLDDGFGFDATQPSSSATLDSNHFITAGDALGTNQTTGTGDFTDQPNDDYTVGNLSTAYQSGAAGPLGSSNRTAALNGSTTTPTRGGWLNVTAPASSGFSVAPSFLDSGAVYVPGVGLDRSATPAFLSSGSTPAPAVSLSQTASPTLLSTGTTPAPAVGLGHTASLSLLDGGTTPAPATGLGRTATLSLLDTGATPAPATGLGESAAPALLDTGTTHAPTVGLSRTASLSFLDGGTVSAPTPGLDRTASTSFLDSGTTHAPGANLVGALEAAPSFLNSGTTHAPAVGLSKAAAVSFLASGATHAPQVGLGRSVTPALLDAGAHHGISVGLGRTASVAYLANGTTPVPTATLAGNLTGSPSFLNTGQTHAPTATNVTLAGLNVLVQKHEKWLQILFTKVMTDL